MSRSLEGGLLLILSNLTLLPAVWISIINGYAIDSAVLFMMFSVSSLYHACDAGFYCITDLRFHRIQDHFMCTSVLSWLILCLVGVPIIERFSIFFIIVSTYVLFSDICVESGFFNYTIVIFLIIFAVVRFLGFGKKISRFDKSDMLIAIVLFGIAYIPYILADPDNEEDYPVYHSLWHALSMPAIYFIIESRDGIPFYKHVASFFVNYYTRTRDFIFPPSPYGPYPTTHRMKKNKKRCSCRNYSNIFSFFSKASITRAITRLFLSHLRPANKMYEGHEDESEDVYNGNERANFIGEKPVYPDLEKGRVVLESNTDYREDEEKDGEDGECIPMDKWNSYYHIDNDIKRTSKTGNSNRIRNAFVDVGTSKEDRKQPTFIPRYVNPFIGGGRGKRITRKR